MRYGRDPRSVVVARAFFQAATKLSDDDEDILPQEDGADEKLSVYCLFSELFPEHVVLPEGGSLSAKTGLTRLQFNKLGYEMYIKEQSRRVPAPKAKPGNPGYGFRRAKWRSALDGGEDQEAMQLVLQSIGLSLARCDHVRQRVDEFRLAWERARRPSRPAGPGRPRARGQSDYDAGGGEGGGDSGGEAGPASWPGAIRKAEQSIRHTGMMMGGGPGPAGIHGPGGFAGGLGQHMMLMRAMAPHHAPTRLWPPFHDHPVPPHPLSLPLPLHQPPGLHAFLPPFPPVLPSPAPSSSSSSRPFRLDGGGMDALAEAAAHVGPAHVGPAEDDARPPAAPAPREPALPAPPLPAGSPSGLHDEATGGHSAKRRKTRSAEGDVPGDTDGVAPSGACKADLTNLLLAV